MGKKNKEIFVSVSLAVNSLFEPREDSLITGTDDSKLPSSLESGLRVATYDPTILLDSPEYIPKPGKGSCPTKVALSSIMPIAGAESENEDEISK